jgi:hypothetical protein
VNIKTVWIQDHDNAESTPRLAESE